MAKLNRDKNCSNCANCIIGAVRRFRCIALPSNPGTWWDGFPEEHACDVYYKPKVEEKKPIIVK